MIENHALPKTDIAQISDRLARNLSIALGTATLAFIAFWIFSAAGKESFDTQGFLIAFAVGALAQLLDGALGMAYGITANSLLLATGLSPAAATATVHVAEAFTTAGSGLAHWKLGNIDKRLFGRIVIPGVLGGVGGVLLVASVDGRIIRPWISAYLLLMGLYIIYRAFRSVRSLSIDGNRLVPVAAFGGFADSVGGGGWGPVVTSTLLGAGREPRTTIGTVNAAEFFVTLASGFSFAVLIGIQTWASVIGLIAGGLLVAPFAARLTRLMPKKALMIGVGLLISSLSAWTILRALGL